MKYSILILFTAASLSLNAQVATIIGNKYEINKDSLNAHPREYKLEKTQVKTNFGITKLYSDRNGQKYIIIKYNSRYTRIYIRKDV